MIYILTDPFWMFAGDRDDTIVQRKLRLVVPISDISIWKDRLVRGYTFNSRLRQCTTKRGFLIFIESSSRGEGNEGKSEQKLRLKTQGEEPMEQHAWLLPLFES